MSSAAIAAGKWCSLVAPTIWASTTGFLSPGPARSWPWRRPGRSPGARRCWSACRRPAAVAPTVHSSVTSWGPRSSPASASVSASDRSSPPPPSAPRPTRPEPLPGCSTAHARSVPPSASPPSTQRPSTARVVPPQLRPSTTDTPPPEPQRRAPGRRRAHRPHRPAPERRTGTGTGGRFAPGRAETASI